MSDSQNTAWTLPGATWTFFVRREENAGAVALRWWWRATGANGVIWDGSETFETLPICQADAAKHGFSQPPVSIDT